MPIDQQAAHYTLEQLKLSPQQVKNALELLFEQDCTIPFIARYRKEQTLGLDEVQIRDIQQAYEDYQEREKRRTYILETLKKQEQLTPDLEKKVLSAETLNQLEDLYAPYKQKKKTKGSLAIEAGLEKLAELILTGPKSFEELKSAQAESFINKEKKFDTGDKVMQGALDIITERMAHDSELKEKLRQDYWKEALLVSSKRSKAEEHKDWQKYRDYFEFSQQVSQLKESKATHRFLAMRRGMSQKILKVEVGYPAEVAQAAVEDKYIESHKIGAVEELKACAQKAWSQFIHPSLDLEIKSELKKLSDAAAIDVFGVNLKNLLLQPYLGAKTVLGVDPGVRTGLKLALVDNTGKFLVDTVLYPHPPQNEKDKSRKVLEAMIDQFNIEYIAIGNGTYGRETLEFVQKSVAQVKQGKVKATLISEAGASIYSASDIARKEFPDKDPTVRGAISIARRFQDPLAELVKIDPKSIGVGQYQHDVNQAKLKKSLSGVVEDCVNFVGVDLNTASAPLLSHISGITDALAQNVVKYREKSGGFQNRQELLNVQRFGPKVFEQAAGFLRLYSSELPLDATFIHPERYEFLEKWVKEQGRSLQDLVEDKELIAKLEKDKDFEQAVGGYTHQDIVRSLRSPSQDPRTEFKSTEFRTDMDSLGDLKIDEWYPGVVTNITQFGAFVDIGLKENGLLHVSQIADRFIENALEVLKVGEEIKVRVMEVDLERKRISLSCKSPESSESRQKGHAAAARKKDQQTNTNHSKKHDKKEVPLKNNAFAALKDFKVK
jgi:uncharacterized protein